MEKKKLIAASLGGVVLIGAGAYMYLQSGQKIDTPNATEPTELQNQSAVNQTETPDATQETETLSEPAELTEAELHELFEGVYIASMESVRENPPKNKETQIAYEFNQLEAECEQGKKLPSDYKVQYREWRENYKLSDLSILFTDVMQEMYIINSAYTYADIYKDSKLSLLVGGEEVYVTGIGFDAATNWYRIENEYGEGYIESENVSAEQLIENQFTPVNEVRYATDADKVICYDKVDTGSKSRSLAVYPVNGKVTVIGIGYGKAEGWLKIEVSFMGNVHYTFYVQDQYLSASKDTQGQQGTKENNADNEGSGGQQDNNGSGGDQGSNNSGGNTSGQSDTGDYWQDHYGMTAEELRNLSDEELIALGFRQRSNGTWVDEDHMMLPIPEPSEEDYERGAESSEGVKWYG